VKIKFDVEAFKPSKMLLFADWCGWSLARAHARSGASAAISGYLGSGEVFDRSIAAFAVAYADQCARDYERVAKAVRDGKLKAHMED
jgi:hypothetical protein